MSGEEPRFLPYEAAARLVAAIQEEEDLDNPERHVLMVYNHDDRPVCWFDFAEVMRDAGVTGKGDAARQAVTEYILHHIPDWADV